MQPLEPANKTAKLTCGQLGCLATLGGRIGKPVLSSQTKLVVGTFFGSTDHRIKGFKVTSATVFVAALAMDRCGSDEQ